MYLVERSDQFDNWLKKLKDRTAVARILIRIKRIEMGQLGVTKPLKDGLLEFKIDYGPGYRLYYAKKGELIILLVLGGSKSTQKKDIKKAKAILKEMDF
jgi:putative addiction module killer protein